MGGECLFVFDNDFAFVAHDGEQVAGLEVIEKPGDRDNGGNAVFPCDDKCVGERAAAFGENCGRDEK